VPFAPAKLSVLGSRNEELDRALLRRLNLSPGELTPKAIRRIWLACADDEDFFISHMVRTKNEHTKKIELFPYQEYVKNLLHRFRTEPVVYIEKTRQMVVTWTVAAHLVYRAKFSRNYLGFFQSKREEDAANVVFNKEWGRARCAIIESNLPTWMQSKGARGTYGKLLYPTDSLIWGIPQGEDVLRSYTATEVVMDECSFWPAFAASHQAALPMIEGGGNLICLSTAKPYAHFGYLLGKYQAGLEAH
jgi:hypothetical protein